jgi:hypothetical protein
MTASPGRTTAQAAAPFAGQVCSFEDYAAHSIGEYWLVDIEKSDGRNTAQQEFAVSTLRCEIATQERQLYSADNMQLVLAPGAKGQLGILPHHAPLLTLDEGVMQVKPGVAQAGRPAGFAPETRV